MIATRYAERFDETLQRPVRAFPYQNRELRFPAILGGRFEVMSLLACGGFGALLVARDNRIFCHKVLVKTGILAPHLFEVPNNLALPRELETQRERMEHERKMLLHAQRRGVSGVPILIDWLEDVSPQVRGPHRDRQGQEFFHLDQRLWGCVPCLVMSYVDGVELNEYCRWPRFRDHCLAACRHLGLYLAGTLEVFHRPEPFGEVELQFVYQDLKPANIMATSEGIYCLIDFGSFATITPRGASMQGTHTEGYAAPELQTLDPGAACKPRLDVYSLGVVLKECLQLATASGKPKLNPPAVDLKVPDDWTAFLDRCTEPDPEKRFQAMGEVKDVLISLGTP